MSELSRIYGKATLCWACQKAVADEKSSCRWSRVLWDIEGWHTERGHTKNSIRVVECPEFLADKSVVDAAKKSLSKTNFDEHMLHNRFSNALSQLDYSPMPIESYRQILSKYA